VVLLMNKKKTRMAIGPSPSLFPSPLPFYECPLLQGCSSHCIYFPPHIYII
jgi:hypothetical protein